MFSVCKVGKTSELRFVWLLIFSLSPSLSLIIVHVHVINVIQSDVSVCFRRGPSRQFIPPVLNRSDEVDGLQRYVTLQKVHPSQTEQK